MTTPPAPAPTVSTTNLATKNFALALFAPLAGVAGQLVEISGWTGGGKYDDGTDIPKGPVETDYFDLGDAGAIDDALRFADELAARGMNVYFGVAPRFRKQPKGKRGRNEDVDHITALWVDLDPPKDERGQYGNVDAWKNKTLGKVEQSPVQASARVDSGHGFHLYWFLKEPLTDIERAKALLDRMIGELGGDTASRNVSRILRLPGPPNVKRPDKPVPTSVKELRSDMRFDVELLEREFKKREPVREERAAIAAVGAGRRLYEKDKKRILEVWGAGSRHEPALAVAGAARKAGWTLDEARTMVLDLAADGGGDTKDLVDVVRTTYSRPIEEVEGWALLRQLGFQDDELKSIQSPPKKVKVRSDLIFDDIYNGDEFKRDHAENLCYAKDSDGWFRWDGRRWTNAAKTEVEALGIETARRILKSAQEAQKKDAKAADGRTLNDADKLTIIEWAEYSQSYRARQAMLKSAAPGMLISTTQLDQHPYLLNVANGTLDLRTGELRPHSRKDLISRVANVEFLPDAEAPLWERFLDDITCEDVDLFNFIQVAAGYSLTGLTDEQCFFLLHGTGRNGKSTFIETFKLLLGDLAQTTPFDTFLARQFDRGVPVDIAMLRGARMVTASEPDEGARLSESIVKQLTGQDEVAARFMRENFFRFMPQFKLWLLANHKPKIRGTDEGIWRRVKLVPFKAQFDGEKRDLKLKDKLKAELPGILRWAVKGAQRWFEKGLPQSKVVDAATSDYRSEEDVLGRFLESDALVRGPGFRVTSKALFEAFSKWCERENELAGAHWSSTKFGRSMREKGFASEHGKGGNFFEGIALATSDEGRDWQQRRIADA